MRWIGLEAMRPVVSRISLSFLLRKVIQGLAVQGSLGPKARGKAPWLTSPASAPAAGKAEVVRLCPTARMLF